MANIEVIGYDESDGRLREIYDDLIKSRGKLADVHMIQSLNPESIVKHMDLYLNIMFGKSPLKRVQREMIAVVVSSTNNCEYCQIHHAEAVNHFWKDEQKTEALRKDYTQLDLSAVDKLFCDYAADLTRNPDSASSKEIVQKLKDLEVEDRSILDATLVISYFNFVNRMVVGLGVEPEEDAGKGFEYD